MSTTPATPVSLLAAWETSATPAQVAAQLPHQPAVLAWLTQLAALPHSDVNVNLDDARTVLHGAGAIRTAQASVRGESRAASALRLLLAELPADWLAGHALLSIQSSLINELEMDELSELSEVIHTTLLGNKGEMIFGHCSLPELAPGEVRVWLLLGLV